MRELGVQIGNSGLGGSFGNRRKRRQQQQSGIGQDILVKSHRSMSSQGGKFA
jgi:hypothetical protein